MAAHYIDALIFPEEEGWRWNATSALGTPVSVSYSFMSAVPSYAAVDGFQPFSPAQEIAAGNILSLYAEVCNITFVEMTDPGAGGSPGVPQIRLGNSTQDI